VGLEIYCRWSNGKESNSLGNHAGLHRVQRA